MNLRNCSCLHFICSLVQMSELIATFYCPDLLLVSLLPSFHIWLVLYLYYYSPQPQIFLPLLFLFLPFCGSQYLSTLDTRSEPGQATLCCSPVRMCGSGWQKLTGVHSVIYLSACSDRDCHYLHLHCQSYKEDSNVTLSLN